MKFPVSVLAIFLAGSCAAADFETEILPFLEARCLKCHGGEKTRGEVDFSKINTLADAETHHELWETVANVIEFGEMPPDDEEALSEEERTLFPDWYHKHFLTEIEAKPAEFRPRRLSGPEYRNTLRTLFGFDLQVNIIEAEQTVTEKSLVLKLLPTDPPGASGYINDTRGARLSTAIWDQYAYLIDTALDQFLSSRENLTEAEAKSIAQDFLPRAWRRTVPDDQLKPVLNRIVDTSTLKNELKVVLMSPAFLYRGFMMPGEPGKLQQPVDQFELAERLAYFLWEDMPDSELMSLAEKGELNNPDIYRKQIDRMLVSPKSGSLAESFGKQWLLLDQIKDQRNDPANTSALKNQPLDFLNYIFTEDRPVMELIDSRTTFINNVTAVFYPGDRRQLKNVAKPRGIERMAVPNQRITLNQTTERGGILTMPGILSMNKGPILRGTWMLRQILGERLGEPPADVPAIQSAPKGQNLTFRERFEQHRANESCAICHDKMDPLGFALEAYDEKGHYHPQGKDTSGQLPGGKSFTDFAELKSLLLTTRREDITRNAVEQLLAYALCRKLERFDRPTVDALTKQIVETDGTWRDLIHGIANSLPFTETVISTTL